MKILSFLPFLFFYTGIYNLHFTRNDGSNMLFSSFKGKKILIVNTARNSKYSDQYGKLEQLYQSYKDSLVIIAFPSNDFNNEPGNDQDINNYVSNTYGIHYVLASKQNVTGDNAVAIYKWLTQSSQNGVMDNPVPGDFTKFLIDSQGNIMGIFSGSVDPMSDNIKNAVAQ